MYPFPRKSKMNRDELNNMVRKMGSLLYDDFVEEDSRTSGNNPYRRFESDSSKFKVLVNVKHFQPQEIDVMTVDNFVVIHGRHEEYADEHGFVSREFTRRYQLPNDVEPEKVKSYFSRNGILEIEAQRKVLEPPPNHERIVPITIQ